MEEVSKPQPSSPAPSLKENGLYICLTTRNDPPLPNDFHWALYLHHNSKIGGTKYHIIGSFQSGWFPSHGPVRDIMKTFLLVGLYQIAEVPAGLEDHVDRSFKTYDAELNTPEITCRVWLWRVLELLQKPVDGVKIFKCEDSGALERELMEWGNLHAEGASKNLQPRPIHASTLCAL